MPESLFITGKEIQIVTGQSAPSSSRLIALIKDTLGKKKHQRITYSEFANYIGVSLQELKNSLKR
jgi:hypothetical protein